MIHITHSDIIIIRVNKVGKWGVPLRCQYVMTAPLRSQCLCASCAHPHSPCVCKQILQKYCQIFGNNSHLSITRTSYNPWFFPLEVLNSMFVTKIYTLKLFMLGEYFNRIIFITEPRLSSFPCPVNFLFPR